MDTQRKIFDELRSTFPDVSAEELTKVLVKYINTSKNNPDEDQRHAEILNLCVNQLLETDNSNAKQQESDANGTDKKGDDKEAFVKSKQDGGIWKILEDDSGDLWNTLKTEVQQIMALFPEVDISWARQELLEMHERHNDNFVERVCNYMISNPNYPTKAKGKGKRTPGLLVKKSSSNSTIIYDMITSPKSSQELKRTHSAISNDNDDWNGETLSAVKKSKSAGRIADDGGGDDSGGDDIGGDDGAGDVTEEIPGTSHQELSDFSSYWNLKRVNSAENNVPCDCCTMTTKITRVVGCLNGHLVCEECLKKQAKQTIINPDMNDIFCPEKDCIYTLKTDDLKSHLPDALLELLMEKIEKFETEKLETSMGVFRCPECGFAAIPPDDTKCFECENENCKKFTCICCGKDWIDETLHKSCRKNSSTNFKQLDIQLPDNWTDTDPYSNDFTRVEVDKDSEEFRALSHSVSSSNMELLTVERVQNARLWNMYSYKKQLMIADNGEDQLNEVQLFHGTMPQNIPVICQEGFDHRVASMGGAIGAGTYFAAQASTSYGYCRPSVQGARVQMFVSMVLAGRCGPGQSGLRRPPAGYDSVGGVNAVVVVFDRMQCYPQYVIRVCMKGQ